MKISVFFLLVIFCLTTSAAQAETITYTAKSKHYQAKATYELVKSDVKLPGTQVGVGKIDLIGEEGVIGKIETPAMQLKYVYPVSNSLQIRDFNSELFKNSSAVLGVQEGGCGAKSCSAEFEWYTIDETGTYGQTLTKIPTFFVNGDKNVLNNNLKQGFVAKDAYLIESVVNVNETSNQNEKQNTYNGYLILAHSCNLGLRKFRYAPDTSSNSSDSYGFHHTLKIGESVIIVDDQNGIQSVYYFKDIHAKKCPNKQM